MNWKSTLITLLLLGMWSATFAQLNPSACIQDATIIAPGNQQVLYFCQGDGLPDVVRFRVTPFAQPFAYLITDEKNIIIEVSRNNNIDFEGLPEGNLRVWAFAYLGNLLAKPGDDATTTILADYCYALTQNFIPVRSVVPSGGTVATTEGRSAVFTCADDGNPDEITFTTTSADPLYRYVITDENNIIVAIAVDNDYDFETLPNREKLRVWGVSYVGNILAKVGDNLLEVDFASGCFDLSSNFVEVTRSQPEGGTVSLSNGETSKTLCAEDLDNDILTFQARNNAPTPYAFLVTNNNGVVLEILSGNTATLSISAPGECRVYGLSYTGNLSVEVGDNINTTPLSDDCFDLSSNFVRLVKREVDGGMVRLAEGGTSKVVCIVEGDSEGATFANNSTAGSSNYRYLITDENNTILAVIEGSNFSFRGLNARNLRVWGLSFSGNLLASTGANVATSALSSECYDLSDNFVSILRQSVDGGTVNLESGATRATVCVGDNQPDVLAFRNNSPSLESYVYVVTDLNGVVIGFINGNQLNFDNLTQTEVRVYGLSYSGSLSVAVGENINEDDLASNCFDLSNNFVTLTRTFVDGGAVSLEDGSTSVQLCLGGSSNPQLTLENTSTATESYAYLLTDDSNNIIAISTDNLLNFSDLSGTAFRIWGVSYSGNLTAEVGENAAQVMLSDGCFELSGNFITVTGDAVDGGTVQLVDGSTSAVSCLGVGDTSTFTFENDSEAAADTYLYAITNTNAVVLRIETGSTFGVADLPTGTYRVYGVSFTGNSDLTAGDTLTTAVISDECYDISDNFVTLIQTFVDGATVSLGNGDSTATVCALQPGGTLRLSNTSTATASYNYVITDANNNLLAVPQFFRDSFNFANLPRGAYRIWGVSFSGTIVSVGNQNIQNVTVNNGCIELSSNFVTINVELADGGTIVLAGGATNANSCLNDATQQEFVFENTSSSNAVNDTYYYVITTATDPTVLAIDTSETIDFEAFTVGTYRVYGLSVSGNLLLTVGGSIEDAAIASQCFDFSDNFVIITRTAVDGGAVSLVVGGASANVCNNSDSTSFEFANNSSATGSYVYLITDTNNVIIAVLDTNVYDFGGETDATFRVWGLSYTGELTAEVGENAATAALSDECFELSENFITITRQQVDGATVSLPDGSTSTVACLGVAEIGELDFVNTSDAAAAYTYVVTDTFNVIRGIATDGSFNFNTLPIGTYRVWGVSYTGNLTAAVGNPATVFLADACFELSSNFITVVQKDVDGAMVSLTNGDTTTFVCGTNSTPGVLTFETNSEANGDYIFLVTDRNNRIIVILNGNSVSFNGAAIGEYRIYGLSYTGTLLARVGSRVDTLTFSDECFDLSDNFVRITRDGTDGGTISTDGGATNFTFCPGNGQADRLTFQTTGNSSGRYIYILTDNNNNFISTLSGNSINFDTIPEGTYRIRGLALTGNLTIQPGRNVTQGALSSACFSLSGNFITINNQTPDGGTVSFEDDLTQVYTCPADADPDFVRFFRQDVIGGNFVFLVTDTNNVIEAVVPQDSFDFERPTEGTNRVWGLAYSGTLTATVGDTVTTAELSSDCYDLSDNFIEVVREIPNGGIVSLENGDTSVFVCANSENPQIVQFDSTGTSRGEYIYVITDSNNVIRNGIAGDRFDFSFLSPPGVYRVWGLAYTGNLIATIGDTVTVVPISDDCFTLSENFVTVIISNPDGGAVTANGGTETVLVCSEDGESDPIALANTSQALSAGYVYLITDGSNRVVQILEDNTFNFVGVTEDTVRVWGLSYAGDLLVQIGDNAATATLASGCAELSSNFVTIIRANVSGATIASDRSGSVIYTCINDGMPDLINFSSSSNADAQYRFVITNENNVIRGFVNGSQFNFETAGRGVSRIWGVSFTGNFTAAFGANITTATLSNGCFDLSENFITVSRDEVLGGEITADNQTELIFCPSPEIPGVVMSTTSERFTGYQYVITDVNNDVIKVVPGDTIRFDSLPVGNYRIWGLSYAGDVLVQPGDNILGVDLASSCFEISASFVTIYRSTLIDGGRIFNLEGGEVLTVCQTDTIPDLVILENNSDAKDADYRYIVTDENNRIVLRNLESDVIDFNRAARGTYRIWGVSYTGEFTALANDNAATAVLSDSCYQLSENFIMVNVETPNPGRVLTSDSLSVVEVVVGDDSSDVFAFIAQGAVGGTLNYLVIDSAEVIVAIITNDSLDFATFDPGTYRVRSVVFDGNLTAVVGDTATTKVLSDGCYALSTSSVRITVSEGMGIQSPIGQRRAWANLTVSPNPVVNKMRIDFEWSETPAATNEVLIFNMIGQPIYQARIPATEGANQVTIGLEELPDGMYILQLRNGGEVQSIRFLKQWQ